ncbi:MAG: dihydrolipoyllysine-residue succinyltransferase [Rhodospirillaceae bacterium]|nr:dihydrolipoyllysine-residue succinyltransferase [Rhodospirillaceae bacterium]|tara:strand:+ start:1765 stop:3024 length:1260 start_codon:yes stop_codon:yes gene_type:complete
MNVLMPQLGETVAEGKVAVWHKKEGDSVSKDEILADVETDKAAVEIPSPAEGVIGSLLVPEGETVDVGTVIAIIKNSNSESTEQSNVVEEKITSVSSAKTEAAAKISKPQKTNVSLKNETLNSRLKLSPVVRRLLAEYQLDAQQISGTGRDGRITRNDVVAILEKQKSKPTARPSQQPMQPNLGDGERIAFDRIRRITAEHMVRSKATSPHVLQAVEVDFSEVELIRSIHKERWKSENGYSLTYLPFIARATCLALREFPRLNGSVDAEELILHKGIHLSIAVDLHFEGLLAPVISDADGFTVLGLARRIHEISLRAREGHLTADELSGGTYTLSNNGSFGTLLTGAIINQPQVGILSIDAIKKRPIVIEDSSGDSIAIRPVGILSQSFDHRAVDGSYSAAFLHKIRTLIEEKDWSAEL